MRSEIEIAVVIPTYNRSKIIRKTIESVFNQTYLPMEIIVADDCSTDDTKIVVEEISKKCTDICVRYCCLEKNSGAQAARNLGIKKADCDWIAFLDSDDTWLPNKLAKQVEIIKKNNNNPYLVVHGAGYVYEEGKNLQYKWNIPRFMEMGAKC